MMSPNKHMQRAGRHKVLGRGLPSLVPCSVQRARVLPGQRAGADVGRSATLVHVSGDHVLGLIGYPLSEHHRSLILACLRPSPLTDE
jgi:hypothetical protein